MNEVNTVERPVKQYPLDLQNCSGDDGPGVMSKGHHDFEKFKAEAVIWWVESLDGWDGPRHEWWRVVPDQTGDYKCLYHPAKPGARGAFPVTVMDHY
ncbi:MAG: hypothetical protein RL710_1163 [Pseudomonadota bacterium]|jgi:hypothetical protein